MFGLIIRKVMTGILYDKILKVHHSELSKASAGKLISLTSSDMAQIEQGAYYLPFVISAPVSCLLSLSFLLKLVSKRLL